MRNTQLIELNLRGGVTSNESGYAVGPGLRRSQNSLWRPYSSQDELRRRILSMPPGIEPTAFYTLANGSHHAPYRALATLAAPDIPPAFGVITALETTTNHFLIYSSKDGSLISDTGVAVTDGLNASGSVAYWPDIAKPTAYMSHQALGKIYQLTNSGITEYIPANGPGQSVQGNTSMIIHLDRLWLPKNRQVWYTDPLDPTVVRAENFVRFNDIVTSLFRANSSPVDAGAGTHLIVGLRTDVWVIDGDPTTGNAIGRRLAAGVGVADNSCAVETEFGSIMLGTNGQLYVIPPGAQQMTPIGQPIRDQVRNYQVGVLNASIRWFSPYVYVCFANLNIIWVLDLSDMQNPKWWGPMTSPNGSRAGRLFNPVGHASESFLAIPTDVAPLPVWPVLATTNTKNRQAIISTGYLQVEGHKIELKRVVVETVRATGPANLLCTVHTADGTTSGYKKVLPATQTPTADTVGKIVFDFSIQPVVSDFCWFEFTWDTGQHADLHRAYAEIRTQPRQDNP